MKLLLAACAFVLAATPALAADKKPVAKAPAKGEQMVPLNIDTNKDGKISLDEAKALAGSQFALYDQDKSGAISMAEYRAPLDQVAKMKKFSAPKLAAEDKVIKSSFGRMDADKNGQISKAEYLNDAELRQKTMDLNHDGFVTPQEVDQLQKKIHDLQRQAVEQQKKVQ